MTKHRYDLACPKLEESERHERGAGTLRLLAQCYKATGKPALARQKWLEIATAPLLPTQGLSDAQVRLQQQAREEASREAEALLPRIVVTSETVNPDERLEILVDGASQDAGLGKEILLVPGDHDVEVRVPNFQPWKTRVTLQETGTMVLKIPALQGVPVSPPPPGPTASSPQPIAPAPSQPRLISVKSDSASSQSTQRWAALIAGSAGTAAIVASVAMGIVANARYDEADCNSANQCSKEGGKERDGAEDTATAATVMFGVGSAALATGAILWFTAPRRAPGSRSRTGTTIGIAPRTILVRGTW